MELISEIINGILREIDVMYSEGILKVDDADDLQHSVNWIVGQSLNESNVSFLIESFKSV